ncbi:unnamed protein product [Urochloa decumbens]|uniref:AAA+ ATPase domain-containing protein n=1 Tax=Urochloa decumbens TaxID=240449 RepID=A0ABC9GA44_9POAL
MEFASVALRTLLPKLDQLLQNEYKLQKGVKEGIEFLHHELRMMHAALEKVGEVPIEQLDKLQRIWAQDVRDLSYDMEDIVDTFMVDVQGPDPPGKRSAKKIFKKLIKRVSKVMARREIAQEIKGIRERVREVAERRDRYWVGDIAPAKKTPVDPRLLTVLYTQATKPVGIDEAKEQVLMRLTKQGHADHQKRIVSIAGFGGLGKTTLAKAVYDEIKEQFGCTAFVSVSRNADIQKLLKDMLYQLDQKKFGAIHNKMLDERFLIEKAIESLKSKRYLIVIDDIWDIEPWKIIECALIENNMRSRIITTTRVIDVAKKVGGCYRLKPLSAESSEVLFYGRIFGSKDKCPGNFSEVSKKILKKCGGVPLAIITISSLLADKSDNIKEWCNVCDSIGLGLGNNHGMDSMRKILLLSYYDLPCHLKTCLLYLCIFPEDYKIKKRWLIWRWVAEGFVQHRQTNQSFLDIGESYFNELLNRSLIQPADMDMKGTPHACRVHDTVLDLISSISKEESFITTWPHTVLGDDMESKVRRLSLHSNTTWPTMDMPKLRSLSMFKSAAAVINRTPSLLSRYHLLRVLDLRGRELKSLASLGFIGSLSHLRYLGLSSYADDQLPLEIGNLQFLQTLDLSETEVKQLPSSITGLRQLICLHGGYRRTTRLPDDGLKKLTSLEVLESVIITSKCIAEELGHLTRLRVLMVTVWLTEPDCSKSESDGSESESDSSESDDWMAEFAKALVESLGKLKKIESLEIEVIHAVYLDGSLEEPLGNLCRLCIKRAPEVPMWIRPAWLPVLSYLDIKVTYEHREDIQILGRLPCLRYLSFATGYGCKEERCTVGPDAFPHVVRCKFELDTFYPRRVVPSMFPPGAMPELQDFKFEIRLQHFCSGGELTVDDDLALAHLPSLRSVTVAFYRDYPTVSEEVVTSIREKLEHEAAVHPNYPHIDLKCYSGGHCIVDDWPAHLWN